MVIAEHAHVTPPLWQGLIVWGICVGAFLLLVVLLAIDERRDR